MRMRREVGSVGRQQVVHPSRGLAAAAFLDTHAAGSMNRVGTGSPERCARDEHGRDTLRERMDDRPRPAATRTTGGGGPSNTLLAVADGP